MTIRTTSELRSLGVTKRRLADLVDEGSLLRVRLGRYADANTDPDVLEAVRSGGILGCVSALRSYGVWVLRPATVHVHLAAHASHIPSGRAVRHWGPLVESATSERVHVLDALLVAMVCLSLLEAVAAVDSALHLGLVRLSDLRPFCLDSRRRRILELADGRSESGLETILRVALVLAGLRVEIQVRIDGTGRVDLLVEGCVVVEADGAEWHSGPRRHTDYVRDAATTTGGRTALRFDGAQILGDLVGCVLAVIAAVRQRRGAPLSGAEARSARIRVEKRLSSVIRDAITPQ